MCKQLEFKPCEVGCEQALLDTLVVGQENEGELETTSLEFEFLLKFPVATHQLSCQISANRHKAETNMNVNKH